MTRYLQGGNEDQKPRMENIDVGSKEGRIWGDEETNEVIIAANKAQTLNPQPSTRKRVR